MEQNQNQNPQNNPQAQQPPQFVCTGDCKKCRSMQQWSYCASIHAYSNMKVLDRVMETLVGMQAAIQAMHCPSKDRAVSQNRCMIFPGSRQCSAT
jgi:hypothetical protein